MESYYSFIGFPQNQLKGVEGLKKVGKTPGYRVY